MAFTERYVEVVPAWANTTAYTTTPLSLVTGSDGYAYYCISAHTSETGVKGRPTDGTDYATYWTICDGTATKPFTWAQMITDINTPRAGYRYNVKAGSYTGGANVITADGTTATPNIIRGYKTNIGDLDPGGASAINRNHATYGNNYRLVTTDMPDVTYTGTGRLNGSGADNTIVLNIKFVGACSATVADLGINGVFFHCVAVNSSTNTNARGLGLAGTAGTLLDCDAQLTGGSGGSGAFYSSALGALIHSCRVIASGAGNTGHGIGSSGGYATIINSIIELVGGNAIAHILTTTNQPPPIICGCTAYNTAGDLVSIENAGYLYPLRVIGNVLTGASEGFYNGYIGTADLAIVSANNAVKATNKQAGFDGAGGDDGWINATGWGDVTPSTTTSEFNDSGNNDYRLETGAVSINAGVLDGDSIGALKPKYTLPTAANVWKGSGTYGLETALTTPTKIATSIPTDSGTLEAADIVSGVTVDPGADQIEGSAAGGGGGGLPILQGSVVR